MKLNILKMQGGGAVGSSDQAYGFLTYMPYINQQPVNPTTMGVSQTQTDSTTSKDSDKGILSDEIVKTLLKDGIKSDVEQFLMKVDKLYNNPELYNPFSPNKVDTAKLARQQFSILADTIRIKNNKEYFDKAVDQAKSQGALDEIAINEFGNIIVKNEEGKITQVSANELSKNRDKLKPMTNAELASLRINNLALANDSNITNILFNSVGTDKINKYIKDTINEAEKSIRSIPGYTVGGDKENIKEGLQLIKNGVFKKTNYTESNLEQINSAVDFLYTSMPNNYKQLLAAQAAARGEDPIKGSLNLILKYAGAKKSDTYKITLDMPDNLNPDLTSKKEKGDSKGTTVSTNYYEYMASGTPLNKDSVINFTLNPHTENQFTIKNSPVYNSLTTIDGKALNEISTLGTTLRDTKLYSLIDKSNIYAGNQKVEAKDFDNIGVNTTQGFVYTLLPIKINSNGEKVVDIKLAQKLDKTQKNIPQGATKAEIQKIYDDAEIGEWANFQNFNHAETMEMVRQNKLAPYLVVNGYASNNNFISDDNTGVDAINDREETVSIQNQINNDRKQHNLDNIDWTSGLWPGSIDSFGWSWGDTDMFHTTVFLPISSDAVQANLVNSDNVFVSKDARSQEKVLGISDQSQEIMKTNFNY